MGGTHREHRLPQECLTWRRPHTQRPREQRRRGRPPRFHDARNPRSSGSTPSHGATATIASSSGPSRPIDVR